MVRQYIQKFELSTSSSKKSVIGRFAQFLVGRKEQVHDLGRRLVRQAELAIGAAVLATVLVERHSE